MYIEAVITAQGTLFGAGDAAIARRVLRAHGGTVPRRSAARGNQAS